MSRAKIINFAGGSVIAGKKLKASSGWNDYNGMSGNGTDEFGFSALPGGDSGSGDDFGGAYALDMHRDGGGITMECYYKTYLYSVRCVQD